MRIESMHLWNFRNYRDQLLKLPKGISVFHGNNGQGKTNILEAVFLLATGRSHRTSKDVEMISWGESTCSAQISLLKETGRDMVRMVLERGQAKRIWINDQPARRIGELFGHVAAVLFSPEDLRMIKDGPQMRRRFLDMELSQLRPAYFFALQRYHRALRQRNALLSWARDQGEEDCGAQLDVWEAQLAEQGVYIEERRREFVEELRGIAQETHSSLTSGAEKLDMRLHSKRRTEEEYKEALIKVRPVDIRRQSTTIGPHRDDLLFSINGHDAREYASQGQQRTAVLSLKLSEMRIMRDWMDEWPVLMLDDVMSELDASRRDQLLRYMESAQILVATTDAAQIPGDIEGFFQVRGGNILLDQM